MTSRWGPPQPDDPAPPNNNNNNNNFATATADFEEISDVEWGPRPDQDGYDTDQTLAPRPRKPPPTESCNCNIPKRGHACLDDSCMNYACREECRSNCPAGTLCGNKRLQKRQFKQLQVFETEKKGKGLRLLEPVSRGDIVTEYIGRAVRESTLNRLFRRYQLDRRMYIMALGDGVYLDARTKGGLARFINHSCAPNCVVELWKVRGSLRAAVVALHDMPANTELTFDYQWERRVGRAPTVCHCGSEQCRGTLELPKTLLNHNNNGNNSSSSTQPYSTPEKHHWERLPTANHTLINRTIRVYNDYIHEYEMGECTGFNAETKVHCILYHTRHNKEVWEDLNNDKKKWMVLHKQSDPNDMIAKKKVSTSSTGTTGTTMTSSLVATQPIPLVSKNYLFCQTPVKNGLHHLNFVDRCQRNCNVQIEFDQVCRPPLPPESAEEIEMHAALDASVDGTVWKVTVQGVDIARALTILQKNVAFLEKKSQQEAAAQQQQLSQQSNPLQNGASLVSTELVVPRAVAEPVRRQLPSLMDKHKGHITKLSFANSESKSKQFSKILLEGTSVEEVDTCQTALWNLLVQLCTEANVSGAQMRNLGCLGCELSPQQFQLLWLQRQTQPSTELVPAGEDTNHSVLLRSFERANKCTVWVQALEDQGRVNSSSRLVGLPAPDAPRKVYFGCPPTEVSRLASALMGRVEELARGVKYVYLGGDSVFTKRFYDTHFFDLVQAVTGATVAMDPLTTDHLKVDGQNAQWSANDGSSESDRAALADEIVRLQIECFRDESIRSQQWIFGRDWSSATTVEDDSSTFQVGAGAIDQKNASHCGMEIADIVASLKLTEQVAGHAAIILYRFVCSRDDFSTTIKMREAILACVFLANKAQKASKWRRLCDVIECSYKIFYPGSELDVQSEEASVLEERVIAAEAEILEALDYDIFWRGTDWIRTAATKNGKMSASNVETTFRIVFSGPILSCGSALWLKYGIEYIFTSIASILKADMAALFRALSLIPLKVSVATKTLAESAKLGRKPVVAPSHSLLEGGRKLLERQLPGIEQQCVLLMSKPNGEIPLISRYGIIADATRETICIQGIERNAIKSSILPVLETVLAESTARAFISNRASDDREDLYLEGTWKAVALGNLLLRTKVTGIQLPPATSVAKVPRPAELVKVMPGRLRTSSILTGDGWKGTIQGEAVADDAGRRVGGKCCVPARISCNSLVTSGLRWWIPSGYGTTPSGSISDSVQFRLGRSDPVGVLSALSKSMVLDPDKFPILAKNAEIETIPTERFTPVSVQRWPPEKVEMKEQFESASRKASKKMQDGFCAAALQELQLLRQLHGAIPSPTGHPNFVSPVGIALPGDTQDKGSLTSSKNKGQEDGLSEQDPIFSLLRSNEENRASETRKKLVSEAANIVFQPTPFLLHKFISGKVKPQDGSLISLKILAAWFHDCISILVHCHSNHVLLRSSMAEQLVMDQSGTIKLADLYRSTVIPKNQRDKSPDPLELAGGEHKDKKSGKHDKNKERDRKRKDGDRDRKHKKDNDKDRKHKGKDTDRKRKGRDKDRRHRDRKEDRDRKEKAKEKKTRDNGESEEEDTDDFSGKSSEAPELLLGCPKHSKETDVWALGCLLANMLLYKPLFSGKTRQDLLQSQFKVVGTPQEDNYLDARSYPHYRKRSDGKKYKRGVERALAHSLKDHAKEYEKAADLIAKMLHLDPAQRYTAEQALSHEFMTDYIQYSRNPSFRAQYASDWMEMKQRIMACGREESRKRRLDIMMSTSSKSKKTGEEDDLYDLDDFLANDNKKSRVKE